MSDVSAFGAVLVLALLALGVALGVVIGVLVDRFGELPAPGVPRARHGPGAPHGAQGLLGENGAARRLEETIRRTDRAHPVTVALLDVTAVDRALPPPGRAAANRAVARVVEHRAGEDDIPFALDHHRIGVVFPDSSAGRVWDVLGRVLDDLGTARFTYGDERTSRPLAPTVEVRVGVCRQSDPRSSARLLLSEAIAAVEDAGEHHDEVARRGGRSLFGGPAGGAWLESDGADLP